MTMADQFTGTGHDYQNAVDNAMAARKAAKDERPMVVTGHRIETTGHNPAWRHVVTLEPAE